MIYLPPEIVCGVSNVITYSADIYSFGITLYELLGNLNSPWENILPLCTDELLKQKLTNGFRPSFDIIEGLYPEEFSVQNYIQKLIEKCWHENVKVRPDVCEVSMMKI